MARQKIEYWQTIIQVSVFLVCITFHAPSHEQIEQIEDRIQDRGKSEI